MDLDFVSETCLTGPLEYKYRVIFVLVLGVNRTHEVQLDNKAGYWPSSFFACLWTETKSRSINSQKKNEANIQPYYPTAPREYD